MIRRPTHDWNAELDWQNFESQNRGVEVMVLIVAWDARIHNGIIITEEGIFQAILHDVMAYDL